jgi:eukaryotic-like serine/threonine-protein kinase
MSRVRNRNHFQAALTGTQAGVPTLDRLAPVPVEAEWEQDVDLALEADPGDTGSSSSLTPFESLLVEHTQLRAGTRLDRYELLCPVARGGMGDVWIARMRGKHGFETLVALKTILPGRSQEARSKRMFLDEARIASDIAHVNVARILDLGEAANVLYLVMEWVDGDSVSRLERAVRRRGRHVEPAIALRIIADACSGLQAAHDLRDRNGTDLGVVHRDVSPQNILVGIDGVAKIIDFGIAKARHRVAEETTDGVLKGKLLYMAPEQALGREIDRRADVYSLGAVLYALLAGAPPFRGPNAPATFGFITSGLPPPPLPRRIAAPVANVVLKALAPLAERYATTSELKQAIEGAMVESGVGASREDVAGYVNEYLGERIAARRVAIQRAIDACAANDGALERSADGAGSREASPLEISSPKLVALSRRGSIARRLAPALIVTVCGLSVMVFRRTGPPAAAQAPPRDDVYATTAASAGPERASAPSNPVVESAPSADVAPPSAAPARPHVEPPKHAAAPRSPSAECAPPYVLDSSGIRHYKRACFR